MTTSIKELAKMLENREQKEDFLPPIRGRGRPPRETPMIACVTAGVNIEDKKLIEDIAYDKGMSVSTMMRTNLLEYMKHYIVQLEPNNNRQKLLKEAGMRRFKDEI